MRSTGRPTPAAPAAGIRLAAAFAAASVAVTGCRSTPPPAPVAPVAVAPAPPAIDPRAEATERFYRGKAAALGGDAACARIEFGAALEGFRLDSRPGDPDDLVFAQQLYESVQLYRPLLDGGPDEDRPPAEEEQGSLLASAPAATAEELEAAKREAGAASAGVSFDIPIVLNDAVLRAVAHYQFRSPRAFAAALKRSGAYLPEMRRLLKEKGLPQDLVYVAMIESAFKPQAHSRKGAHGFWQFIDGTGKRYGLARSRWVDERSDLAKSTLAAAAYFRDLYEMFGDWYLAMAAYDTGEGRVLRALQRTGARDYWELCAYGSLHPEAVAYVPYVVATALIAKDPARFGFDVVPDPPMDVEVVEVERPIDLATLGARVGVELAELRELNGELRTRSTPRGVAAYPLRVPAASAAAVRAALSALPTAPEVGEKRVAARKGDTPARIAARHGVGLDELCAVNDFVPSTRLKRGATVVVPVRRSGRDRHALLAAAPAPAPATAERRRGEIRALPTPEAAVASAADLQGLRAASTWTPPPPRPQPSRYDIPAEGFVAEGAAAPRAPSAGARPKPPVVHTVRSGETLYRIARQYGTTIDALRLANDLGRRETLRVGRRLTVSQERAR